jgi:hypothetical protein
LVVRALKLLPRVLLALQEYLVLLAHLAKSHRVHLLLVGHLLVQHLLLHDGHCFLALPLFPLADND